MDPDANLDEQRRIVARALSGSWFDVKERAEDGERLAYLAQALDEWITRGGFLPKAWAKKGG